MDWTAKLRADPLPWLLEDDPENPGVRYFALRDLQGMGEDRTDLEAARRAVMERGPVPAILAAQAPEGYWAKPGSGYGPKYTGTVWSVMFLAQLGAEGTDPRVRAGCDYVLDHSRSRLGSFSALEGAQPSGMVQCLQGNLCASLADLGLGGDPQLDEGLDWLARSITGEGIAPSSEREAPVRYFAGNCGPGFECGANNQLPCAWGAVKAMLALGKVPEAARTPMMRDAIRAGLELLLGRDPAVADYPAGYADKPSGSWFKFGYPLGYVTDVLQNLEALTALGYGSDPRLVPALELVLGKQDAQGRWNMEYTYNGKMWADIERRGAQSKWVTLRAVRALKTASGR